MIPATGFHLAKKRTKIDPNINNQISNTMKKIIIGTLVATVIYFVYQSAAWMGGLHDDISSYTPKQAEILQYLSQNLTEDGVYFLPSVDPNHPDKQNEHQRVMEASVGKPWVMIFYHKSMSPMDPMYIVWGVIYSLIACLIAAMLLYYGKFETFGARFLAVFALGLFAISQGVMDDMNWWSYPWSFVKAQVIDLTIGWALPSLWLGWYMKKNRQAEIKAA
jgi:hypothetical protein